MYKVVMDIINNRGFTLVELLVTIAIAAILMSVVVPSFSTLIESSKEKTARDLLVSSIHLAQQQAKSKRLYVYICATSDGVNCADTWGSDWLVYEDADSDQELTSVDIIISNVSSKVSLVESSSEQISFSPTGHSSINIFNICNNENNTIAHQISLSLIGRVSYPTVSGDCS